jgi:hypothetical protein
MAKNQHNDNFNKKTIPDFFVSIRRLGMLNRSHTTHYLTIKAPITQAKKSTYLSHR